MQISAWPRFTLLAIAFSALALNSAAADTAATVFEKALENEHSAIAERKRFTYQEHHTDRIFDKRGKLLTSHTRTYDVIYLAGGTFDRLVQIDDKPLPRKRHAQEQERERQEDQRRRSESDVAGAAEAPENIRLVYYVFKRNATNPERDERDVTVYPDLIPEGFDLALKNEDTLAGRQVYVITASPRLMGPGANRALHAMSNLQLEFRIDKADLRFAEMNAVVIGEGSPWAVGSRVYWRWRRLDELEPGSCKELGAEKCKAWVPTQDGWEHTITIRSRNYREETRISFANYRRFSSDTKIGDFDYAEATGREPTKE
jgi:hypothetical protein